MRKVQVAGIMSMGLVAIVASGCGSKKPLIDPSAVARVEVAADRAAKAAGVAESAAGRAADSAAKAEAAAAKAAGMFEKGLKK